MATGEKRLPREAFTKKLRRLCERLDERHQRTIPFKHWYFKDRELVAEVAVISLWVAGSYARGALDCGDLDVVLQLAGPRDSPPLSTLTKAFFGTLPYVRYYLGEPAKNSSGVEFPEAVLIWSGPGCDWNARVAAIREVSGAGRHNRPTDAAPLRLEQLGADLDQLASATEARERGELEWAFREFNPESLQPIPVEEIEFGEEYLMRCANLWGKKSQRIVPALLRLAREVEPLGDWSDSDSSRTVIRCGGTLVHVGRPELCVWRLHDNPSIRQLALIPHLTARGPNGAWLIRRGASHPDHQTMRGTQVFYHSDEIGPVVRSVSQHKSYISWIQVLDLFATEEQARQNLKGKDRDIRSATDDELLELTGLCDALRIGRRKLAITWAAREYAKATKPASIAEIASTLKRLQGAAPPLTSGTPLPSLSARSQ
ncbi:hypothetical protein [Variovorax soli]|uniref:Nucleotidyltransferase domain-containing protein n=1 Tax=Variovorax soli TaxID=376815 RepID=A0ABU1NKI4_9BURK|nr:hypothetical protein [Variovorax soli]MDR6538873.1 hypothetical protein [Variovorax soli]